MTKKFTIQFGVFAFIIIFLLVGLVSLYKHVDKKPDYFYVKVLVKKALKDYPYPDITYTRLIKKGDKIKDFMGNTDIEVLSMRYYQREKNSTDDINVDTYKIYLYLKVRGDGDKNEEFMYKKSKIKAGVPFDLNFNKVKAVGEILDMNNDPIIEKYVEKIVWLWRYEGQSQSNPNNFETIKIGESYFDGEEKVLEVISKELIDLQMTGANVAYFNERGNMKHILIKAKMQLKEEGELLYFPDDQPIRYRGSLNIKTNHNLFDWYLVVGIEDK